MDIVNKISEARFREMDDVLAFVSIYEDERRTAAYLDLLHRNRDAIRGKVCVEAGCGLGIFAAEMARMGAAQVFAVEQNPILAAEARRRLRNFPNVSVVQSAIEAFVPPVAVDLLVHEFYGQMLYDESLEALSRLQFEPAAVLPDGGALLFGVVDTDAYLDDYLTASLLEQFEGILVAGLFAEHGTELDKAAVAWQYGADFPETHLLDLSDETGELLVFGVEVTHRGSSVCRAGECENWSLVWTPRAGDRCQITFVPEEIGEEVRFTWLG